MDLLTGPLGNVISKLALLLKEEYELQTGVRNKITRLSRDLESMHAALRKVAEVPPEELDDEVKLWAGDVRELSYDVEDILDAFLVRVEGREAPDPNRLKRAAKKIGELFSRSKARHQIDYMIKIINEKAHAVAERHRRYAAEDIVSKPAAPRTIDPRLEAMYKEVTHLVGIEKPSDELISMLSPLGNDDMKMVSVVGAGGLGKTTLAKAVYDKLKMDFDCTAFVSVGRDPDLKNVFIEILTRLDKDKYMDPKLTILSGGQLIDELREYLTNKRYFVIDDVWKTDTWKSIKYALIQNYNGSRVITTTRISGVADQAGEVYKLQPLPRDQSEKLFYTRIFGANGTYPNNQLKAVPDKILNKCNGVPLAIITMASLLVGKSVGQWNEVCNSIVFRDKKKNQQVSDTEWILSLSYYDLPSHLKTCLLYLSAFPEDFVINKHPLIWKWVAEGFVHKEQGTGSLFEIGEGYFSELINRSMIQAVEFEGIVYGCRVHDMMLDPLRVKLQEVNFATIVSTNNSEDTLSPNSNIRRLAHQNRMVEQTHQDTLADVRHVRTFIAVSCRSHMLSFLSFKLLRVLVLERCKGRDSTDYRIHLEHIKNLLHLRYLGLRETSIYELPEGLGALKFLQTMDLTRTKIKELPSSVGLLTQLICLHVGHAMVPNGLLEKLACLEELHIKINDLVDMRGQFVCLGNLRELRVLKASVQSTNKVIMPSNLMQALANLHKLQHLDLCWELHADAVVVLPQSLRCLILNYVAFLPSCINPSYLPNLAHLKLNVSHMNEQSLRILGRLRELIYLDLITRSTAIVTIYHASEPDDCLFQKLRYLSISGSAMYFALNENSSVTFTIWNADEDDVTFGSEKEYKCTVRAPAIMPNLQVLKFTVNVKALIYNKVSCDRLGLEYLSSLQEVQVDFDYGVGFEDDMDKEVVALRHALEAHPSRPTLKTFRVDEFMKRLRQIMQYARFLKRF